MSIEVLSTEQSNLDNLVIQIPEYQQQLANIVSKIPQFTNLWTNFNDSDPGITLLQLLTWLNHGLQYQASQIPQLTWDNFALQVLGQWPSTSQDGVNETTCLSNSLLTRLATQQQDLPYLRLKAFVEDYLTAPEHTKTSRLQQLQSQVLHYQSTPYLAITSDDIRYIIFEYNQLTATRTGDSKFPQKSAPQVVDVYLIDQADRTYANLVGPFAPQYQQISPKSLPLQGPMIECTSPDTMSLHEKLSEITTKQQAPNRRLSVAWQLQNEPEVSHWQAIAKGVEKHLAPRTLLGNYISVQLATFTPVALSLKLQCTHFCNLKNLARQIKAHFQTLFNNLFIEGQSCPFNYHLAPEISLLLNGLYQEFDTIVAAQGDLHVVTDGEYSPLRNSYNYFGLPLLHTLELQLEEAE